MVQRKRAMLILALFAMLMAFLLPSSYALFRMWQTTADEAKLAESERTGVSYLQPLTSLLGKLVDAQSAAAKGETVDAGAVRAAIEEVNDIDRLHGDELLATERWAPLPDQIESALSRSAHGPDALNAYAVPVGLAQTLLGHIGATSNAVRDPDLAAFSLADGALFSVPEVMVNASAIVALARNATPQTSAIAVAQDRITKATTELGNELHLVDDETTSRGGFAQLTLVDNLTAASLAMIKASGRPSLSAASTLVEIDAAQTRLQKSATALAEGLLAELDSILESRANLLDEEHQRILIAASLAAVAAVGLVWICLVVARRRIAPWVVPGEESQDRRPDLASPDVEPRMAALVGERGMQMSGGAPIRREPAQWAQPAGHP